MNNKGEQAVISVITVCHNAEATIRKTIESVASQRITTGLFEHIVIDGASKDRTLEIVKCFPEVRWISEPDQGISDAFNKGLQLANGSYIIYLNADDYLYDSSVLADACDFIMEQQEPDWIVGDVVEGNDGDTVFRERRIPPSCWSLMFRNRIGHPAVFLRRWILMDVGGFDTSYTTAMDYDLYERLCTRGVRPIYFPRIVSVFSVHGISSTQTPSLLSETQEVMSRFRNSPIKRLIGNTYDRIRSIEQRCASSWRS